MDSQKRKFLILIALLGAWGLVYALRSPWGTPARPEVRGSAPASGRTPAAQGGGVPRLKTELLRQPVPAYAPETHNIFGTPPPPPRPSQAAAAAAPPPLPPPDPFQEEAKRLRYVGFLQQGDRAMAFIVQGPVVHTVELGATLLGRFKVQAVMEDALLLSSPSGDKQVRLPLAVEVGAAPGGAAPRR
jgi:hypothetical protein